MSNYSKITKQDVENINGEDFFEGMSNENRELFKRALSDAVDSEIRKIEEKSKVWKYNRQANGTRYE